MKVDVIDQANALARNQHAERSGVLELPVEYVDVLLWARPVLARGLTLSVQSWEGRTVAGSILFPGRSVPLSVRELSAFTEGKGQDAV